MFVNVLGRRASFNLFGDLNIDAPFEIENIRSRIGPNATINLNTGYIRFQFDERFGTLRFDDVDQNMTIVKVKACVCTTKSRALLTSP